MCRVVNAMECSEEKNTKWGIIDIVTRVLSLLVPVSLCLFVNVTPQNPVTPYKHRHEHKQKEKKARQQIELFALS